MPQIQQLQSYPSPLEQLMPYINQALGSLTQGLGERFENQRDAKIIPAMLAPDLTPLQRIQLSLQLSPKRREAFYSGIRAQTSGEKFGFQQERERRLMNQDVLSGYDRRISQVNADIKEGSISDPQEIKRLKTLKNNLEREQAANRARLRGGKDPIFTYLEQQDTPEAQEPTQLEPGIPNKKQRFNPQNPEHVNKFKQLDQEFAGDRKRVNEALAREFSL